MIRTIKFLIDILFWIFCLGILGFFLVLPFGIFTTKIADVNFQDSQGYWSLPLLYWIGTGVGMITYILFLIALNYLRKAMNGFISASSFTATISKNLYRGGVLFVTSAISMAGTGLIFWGMKVFDGSIKLILGVDIVFPFFLAIVGLFFMLQSKVLEQARLYKEDSNLTI